MCEAIMFKKEGKKLKIDLTKAAYNFLFNQNHSHQHYVHK